MNEYDENDYDDAGVVTDHLDDLQSKLEDVHSTLEQILSTLQDRTDFSGLFWVIVLFFAIAGWSGSWFDSWTDKLWYSIRYSADFSNITVDKRPPDCDFFHAPVGGKGCEYKKRITVFADEQRQELMKQASTSEDRQRYANRPNSVNVYWAKEQD